MVSADVVILDWQWKDIDHSIDAAMKISAVKVVDAQQVTGSEEEIFADTDASVFYKAVLVTLKTGDRETRAIKLSDLGWVTRGWPVRVNGEKSVDFVDKSLWGSYPYIVGDENIDKFIEIIKLFPTVDDDNPEHYNDVPLWSDFKNSVGILLYTNESLESDDWDCPVDDPSRKQGITSSYREFLEVPTP